MVTFYYTRVKLNQITIEQVPTRYREQVQALLDADKNQ